MGLGLDHDIETALGAPLLDALPDLVLAFDAARTTRPVLFANRALRTALKRDPRHEPLGAVLGAAAADVIDAATTLRLGQCTTSTAAFDGRTVDTRLTRVTADVVVWVAADAGVQRGRSEELARSNFDLDRFAFVASHDLVEPLRMITAYLDLLAEMYGDGLDDKGRQYLGFALDGAVRMRALVDALLTLARVNGADPARHAAVALDEVVAETRSTLAVALAEAGARLDAPAGLPVVAGDRGQLGRLFANLVANAVKFGSTTVRIEAGPDDDGRVRVAVTDDGIGIDPEQRHAVFEMFRRLHPRARYGGSGMGLAICKAVVEGHGGEIGIEAGPGGGGTTVWFTLPRAPTKGDV